MRVLGISVFAFLAAGAPAAAEPTYLEAPSPPYCSPRYMLPGCIPNGPWKSNERSVPPVFSDLCEFQLPDRAPTQSDEEYAQLVEEVAARECGAK